MRARGTILGVIFDFGGVIWNMRWDVCRELEHTYGLARGAVFETLYRTEAWEAIERGRADTRAWREQAHRLLEARAGRPLPELHDAWRNAQHMIAENVALVRALRPPYRVALLSNADSSLRERLRDGLGIEDLFDTVVCSAEVGMAKPEPAIYRLTAQRLGLSPEACVFVDDHEPNVAAAEQTGMRGVLFRIDRGHDLAALLAHVGVRPRE
ncbi:MAG: HAD family hydrolase [Candidatus Methylomirabilia bacterium]